MDVKKNIISGSVLEQNSKGGSRHGMIAFPGVFSGKRDTVYIDDAIMSKHMMLIGGTGCGKTNVFYYIVDQIKKTMKQDDLMIVFDTKGDYYEKFHDDRDLVIGNSEEYYQQSVRWNLFREVLSDGWEWRLLENNLNELSWSVLRESIEKSKQPLFPNAARDLFSAILKCMFLKGATDNAYKRKSFYNSELKKAFETSDLSIISRLLRSNKDTQSALSYIGDGSSQQALGVYAELQNTIQKLLIGVFAEKGDFSIRNFVREKGGKTLFVEYDMASGNMLSPIYSLLFDLALKEALGRTNKKDMLAKTSSVKGNVYLICDEFRLLPFLQHIDDGVNFGRSMGVKIVAGLQSINQLTEAYGEYRGKNILAGFSTIFAFKANDSFTRDYITGLHGKNVVIEQQRTIANSIREERIESYVVGDWDMNNLEQGDAIISFPFEKPFRFHFDLYQKGWAV